MEGLFTHEISLSTSPHSLINRPNAVLDHRQSAERAWERLKSAFQFGDCLTTVSTNVLDDAEAEALGLVPTHAYACLDVKEALGTRFLLVSLSYKGMSNWCIAGKGHIDDMMMIPVYYRSRTLGHTRDGVVLTHAWIDNDGPLNYVQLSNMIQ